MYCPFCQARESQHETKVIDSRLVGEGLQVRRRRHCLDCNTRFTTYETIELSLPRVVKRDGRHEAFQLEKLKAGIFRALEKRPISEPKIDILINQLLQNLQTQGEREISTEILGEWVMSALKSLDWVGYVRFASVYRRFEDIQAFSKEIETLFSHQSRLTSEHEKK